MFNLYYIITNKEAIRAFTKAMDRLGNLEPSLNVYPDQMAQLATLPLPMGQMLQANYREVGCD